MRSALIVLVITPCIGGCAILFGESQTLVELYNPQTQEHAFCGQGMHRGSPSDVELENRDKCIAAYEEAGYRPMADSNSVEKKNPN
jgi:hypothetical protein